MCCMAFPGTRPTKNTTMSDHPIIVFDGECNLCESSVQFVIRRDKDAKFKFASAQSEAGQKLQEQYGLDSIQSGTMILVQDGKAYTKSDAALRIAGELDGPWKAMSVFRIVPRFLRNGVYGIVARNRYRWFGKKDECMIPTPDLKERFL